MKWLATLMIIGFSGIAMADNALTSDQLMKSIQLSVQDYTVGNPDMAGSISGLQTTTVGANAQVTISMNTDGMQMSVQYLCVAANQNMICNQQQ